MEAAMNREFQRCLKAAENAADRFFDKVEQTNDPKLLEDDSEVYSLYMKLFDLTDNPDDDAIFFDEYGTYCVYKMLVKLRHGWLGLGDSRTLTRSQLQPIYDEMTEFVTGAIELEIEEKGPNVAAYRKIKADMIESFNEEAQKMGYTIQKGGCYVATAIYGSYDCPQVWTLRRFRDNFLAEHLLGRLFIRIYYWVSPKAVRRFGERAWFNHLWRKPLDVLVQMLQSYGYTDAPYSDFTNK